MVSEKYLDGGFVDTYYLDGRRIVRPLEVSEIERAIEHLKREIGDREAGMRVRHNSIKTKVDDLNELRRLQSAERVTVNRLKAKISRGRQLLKEAY